MAIRIRTRWLAILAAAVLSATPARAQIAIPPTGPGPAAAPVPRAPVPPPFPGGDLYAANLGISYRIEPHGGAIGARLTRYPAPGTAAAQIQLEPGDFITHLDGMPLYGPNDLLNHSGRTTVQFVNIRTGQPQVGVVWISGAGPNPGPFPPPTTYTLGVNVVTVVLPAVPYYGGYAPRAAAYGLQITGLTPGMPAQRAGLEVGDIILSINGRATANVGDLRAALAASNGQASVAVRDVRTGQQTTVPIWLGTALPPGAPAAVPAATPRGFEAAPAPGNGLRPDLPTPALPAPETPGPFAPGTGRPS